VVLHDGLRCSSSSWLLIDLLILLELLLLLSTLVAAVRRISYNSLLLLFMVVPGCRLIPSRIVAILRAVRVDTSTTL
jgi:hypothetical protein